MINEKKPKEKKVRIKDRVIQIILIIIIILLLIHNCSLANKKGQDIIEEGGHNIIDITCDAKKCEQQNTEVVNCLADSQNSTCLVPDFKGQTKKELLKWLNSISNTIEIEIKLTQDSNYPDGTIISQSVVGISIKELLDSKTKLVITIVNNGSLTDCEKDSNNSKCSLPNFVGKKTSSVENWLNTIANQVNIRYVYLDSNEPAGTIINQSIKAGTSVKNILDNNQKVIIYISKGPKDVTDLDDEKKIEPNDDKETESDTSTELETDNDFYANDKEVVKWQDQTNLKIFEDSTNISKIKGKIAPESSGTYKFTVNNGTKYNLKYKISFIETNQYGMNIKYKLKKGDTYIVDHYVSYTDLNIANILLNTQNSDTYYLEWKWVGDNDNKDTHIGNSATSSNIEYELKINIEAESV